MILSDKTIRRLLEDQYIVIDPAPADQQIQPASVDLTLGADFLSPYDNERRYFPDCYTILPGECVLGTTAERIEVPDWLVGRVEGKSSWGRKFLMIHSTAGFIDPGFKGNITLEFVNLSQVSQLLKIGSAIAQISFTLTDMRVERPYGSEGLSSHYMNQESVTASAEPWR